MKNHVTRALATVCGTRLELSACRSKLLIWYRSERRDLPWRTTRDPYRILVSEVMLQQTQVNTVVDRYRAFLDRFPSLESLAAASEEEVVAAWSGLGYYSRARRLHAAVREVSARGSFPSTHLTLRALPGIGDYTASAVASIAFGECVPAVDGNVERVLARVLALADPKSAQGRREIRELAAALTNERAPGESNQALMEVGALLCRPQQATCTRCPLRALCRGAASGNPTLFPVTRKRRETVRLRMLAPFVWDTGRLLLQRGLPDAEWLRGVWHPPLVEVPGGATWPVSEKHARGLIAATVGFPVELTRGPHQLRHAITYRRLDIAAFAAKLSTTGAALTGREWGWFQPRELSRLPLSSLVMKGLDAGLGTTS